MNASKPISYESYDQTDPIANLNPFVYPERQSTFLCCANRVMYIYQLFLTHKYDYASLVDELGPIPIDLLTLRFPLTTTGCNTLSACLRRLRKVHKRLSNYNEYRVYAATLESIHDAIEYEINCLSAD